MSQVDEMPPVGPFPSAQAARAAAARAWREDPSRPLHPAEERSVQRIKERFAQHGIEGCLLGHRAHGSEMQRRRRLVAMGLLDEVKVAGRTGFVPAGTFRLTAAEREELDAGLLAAVGAVGSPA